MRTAQHGAERPDGAGNGERTPAAADGGDVAPPTVLFSCTLTGTVRAVNAVLSRMSARPLADLAGTPVHTLLHPSCHPRLLEVLRDARGGATSGAADLCLRRVDGSWVQLTTSWSVVSHANGDVAQVVFVDADGTVRAKQRRTAPPPALVEVAEHRSAISADPATAPDAAPLHLEYQPIVDLASGALAGLQALARWTHPDPSAVPRSRVVGATELAGLAPDLDRWVVRRALQDMAELRAADVVPDSAYVAVDLSTSDLAGDFAFDDLPAWTEEFGLPRGRLVLAISETAIMQDTDVAARLLRRLRDEGFRIVMDDFGPGYLSLAHLRELPIFALKIDGGVVADTVDEHEARAIAGSIVGLARDVGAGVVAEGVETPGQLAVLRRLGVGMAQGWLWGPAVSPTTLLRGDVWTDPMVPPVAAAAGAGPAGRWKRDDSVAPGLQRLLELHQDGASVAAIAAVLNDEGLCTPAGLPWHRSSVARVLAHQIRRGAGAPDAGAGARRLARSERANPPPS